MNMGALSDEGKGRIFGKFMLLHEPQASATTK